MRRIPFSALPLTVLFMSALSTPLFAQAIEAPIYTPEQRWARASSFATLGTVSAIAYVKGTGQSLEGYFQSQADLFLPGWGDPGTASLTIVRGFLRNAASWTDSEYQIVEQSERSVTARVNRPWLKYFGEDELWYGVTLQEFESFHSFFNQKLAEYKGLGYEDWMDEGWMYVKFSLLE